MKRLLDVNVLAFFMAGDHPGHGRIAALMEDAFSGGFDVAVWDATLVRAHYVLTTRWKYADDDVRRAFSALLEERPIEVVAGSSATFRSAMGITRILRHSLQDVYLIALAKERDCGGIVTADARFAETVKKAGLEPVQPFDEEELKSFDAFEKARRAGS